MKHCPKCDNVYVDSERFCDLDGTLLVGVDSSSLVEENALKLDASQPSESQWKLAVVVIAGLAIGVVLFLVYHGLTRSSQLEKSLQSKSGPASAQPPNPNLALLPSPVPSATSSPEQSPLLTPTASPQTASPGAGLSSRPISTGSAKPGHGPVSIRLVDGSTIEADEAWDGGAGIWYRQHGIVTFLEGNRVKAIEPKGSTSPQSSASPTPSRP